MEQSGRSETAESPLSVIRSRIANACDGCKARKVKCDGKQPCSYCTRRQRPHACKYTAPRRARQRQSQHASSAGGRSPSRDTQRPSPSQARGLECGTGRSSRDHDGLHTPPPPSRGRQRRSSGVMESADDDTEVPREARLLCDAQGKLIFIGDCAPLSLFQSVRQLVNSLVGQTAFAPETSRYSVLENAPSTSQDMASAAPRSPPPVPADLVSSHAANYVATVAGMIDLFDEARLAEDLAAWASLEDKPRSLASAINYLVLAIGCQAGDEPTSQAYFEYAKELAFASLGGSLGVETVQAFVLVTVYMLCSCQINSSFLIFGVAVRAAYSIGVHRTEVNARFGPEMHRLRDRLWKSLRVVDLFLSTSMGRPPATSDVDCTVPYRQGAGGEHEPDAEVFDLLNASVQILLITEGIVLEIFSRKRVSLQRTEGISLRLRQWSADWLQRLADLVAHPDHQPPAHVAGACQVLCSYYYAVMLVSRPFLMYELFRRLGDSPAKNAASGKSKLADACIDSASIMVDTVVELIQQGALDGRRPVIVSWLFAASLVLGLGLLGGFGRILEKHTRLSIQALEHFARSDTHARQYSLIAQSLLTTALEHLDKREHQQRLERTETSSQLFGLIPHGASPRTTPSSTPSQFHHHQSAVSTPAAADSSSFSMPRPSRTHHHQGPPQGHPTRFTDFDSSALFGLDEPLATQDDPFWNMYQGTNEGDALNLFPLLDSGGAIDLAHYLQ